MDYDELLEFLRERYKKDSAERTIGELFWHLRNADCGGNLQIELITSGNTAQVDGALGQIYYGTGNKLVRKKHYVGFKSYPLEEEGDIVVVAVGWSVARVYLYSTETRRIPPL